MRGAAESNPVERATDDVTRPRLSVALITHNEAHNLDACLAAVRWADEIVVVDNGSADATRDIARAAGARVIEAPDWPGFGPQKNRAIDACTGDWVLALDADERVTPALRAEIERALARPAFDVYALPRRSTYAGRFMRHGGWWPDYVTRLFRRGVARYSPARVHESLVTERPVGRLGEPLLHYSFRSLEDVLTKVNRYSTESATMLVARGARPGLGSAVLHGVAAFLRTYVLKLGFLDGRFGFMLAVSNAEGSYYRYVKAMLAAEDGAGRRRDDID
jgi:glycosyltransferase involved in cell wall biosynthesis